MATPEITQLVEALPEDEQEQLFVFLAEKVMSRRNANAAQWLGRKLTFEEACDVVFRENRELLRHTPGAEVREKRGKRSGNHCLDVRNGAVAAVLDENRLTILQRLQR